MTVNTPGQAAFSTFTIFGASDDLIELAGGVDDEVSAYGVGECPIQVDDTIVATITYRGSMWSITPSEDTGPYEVTVIHRAVDDDLRDHPGTNYTRYSDVATVTGPMRQVAVAGESFTVK